MNKRFVIVIIVFIILITIGGCAKESEALDNPTRTSSAVTPVIEKYYELYKITDRGYPEFQYFIFDKNHDVLDYGTFDRHPTITETDGLVKVYIGCGTSCLASKYYDTENRLISEWFINIINDSGSMVVYLGDVDDVYQLIVQDKFNKSKYFKSFKRDFSLVMYPVKEAVFLYGGKQLSITYLTGEDKEEVIEIVDLY